MGVVALTLRAFSSTVMTGSVLSEAITAGEYAQMEVVGRHTVKVEHLHTHSTDDYLRPQDESN